MNPSQPTRPRHWILNGREPVPADLDTWARDYDSCAPHNTVASTYTPGDTWVATRFLGIDMNWSGIGPPLLFETLIFGGRHNGLAQRYATWAEAEAGHAALVAVALELAN